MIPARARRTLIIAGAVVVLLALAGATYQGVATALERRRFPQPGRLVDVGGHQLHLYCLGEGAPTVLLEASAAGVSAAWARVQPRVADVTRACSYDRAGLGWSEMGDRPYDPAAAVEELFVLMQRAGERGPYVLAGQGLGAALAALAAARFGGDAAALVLIDQPAAARGTERPRASRLLNASPWLARTGVLRAMRVLSDNATGLPAPAAGALSAFLNRPDHLTRAAREVARWDETVRLAAGVHLDDRVRVIRVAASGEDRIAFLNERAEADAATASIMEAVGLVRGAVSAP